MPRHPAIKKVIKYIQTDAIGGSADAAKEVANASRAHQINVLHMMMNSQLPYKY